MRSPALQALVDSYSKEFFGVAHSDAQAVKMCVFCHKPAIEFKDSISIKEFQTSGMCQTCQDKTFT